MLLNQDCCACIVWSVMEYRQVDTLLKTKPKNFPLIILNCEYPDLVFDSVRYDSAGALGKAVEHYQKQGFSKMALLVLRKHLPIAEIRLAHLQRALPGGCEVKLVPHDEGPTDLSEYTDCPLIAFNTCSVFWLNQYKDQSGLSHGIRIPVTVSCKKDDVLPPLPLIQLVFSPEELGKLAVERLTARLNGDSGAGREELIKWTFQETKTTPEKKEQTCKQNSP